MNSRSQQYALGSCFACQRRHSRCDRRLPACKECQSRGTGNLCSYQMNGFMTSGNETARSPDVPRAPIGGVSHASVEVVSRAPTEGVSRAPIEGVSRAPTQGVSHAPVEGVSCAPIEDQEQDVYSPAAKRIKLSNSNAKELAKTVEGSPDIPNGRKDSPILINGSDPVREASVQRSSKKRRHSDSPAGGSVDAKALREKWTQKLIEIQSRDPSPGSGSFTSEGLKELSQVLRLTHPNFTKDEDDERKELLRMIERKLGTYYPGSLGWADLSSLRLICLIPEWPDSSLREEFENEACLVDLEASSRKSRPFPATALRRLKRVFERFDPHYQQNGLYHEVKSALANKDMTERWALEAEAVRRCLKHLFPSAEDVKKDKASSSAKKPSMDTETHPAKLATHKKQGTASKDHSASAPAIARKQTPTASLISRSKSMWQMNIEDLDSLLKSFITVHCSILPIFDLPDLKLFYRVVRTRRDDAPASNMAIVCLCFALASRAYDQRTTQQAMDFFNRGSSLLPAVKASGNTMVLIQGHVLQAQYFFEKGDFEEASVAISSAICRAHSEGMHTKTGAYHPISEKELHLRSRIWHAIQVSERTLALYRGVARPNFCSDCNAAFPRAPTISDDDQLPTQQIGYVAFNAWARLYQPVDTLMDIEREFRIYEGGCQIHKVACNFKDYYEEHARLTEWKQSLSGRLKYVPNDSNSDDVSRLRIIIHLRYLYYRLRLHRPFLILALALSLKCTECPDNPRHLLDNSLETPLEFAAIRDGFVKCLIAAVELSRKLHQYTGQDSASRYFQNASLTEHAEFAYACGLVLLAARMVPDLIKRCDSGVTSLNTIQLLEASILALRKYGKADRINKPLCTRITRCADALEALSKAVGDEGPFGFISEGVGFPIKSWQKLYGRLKVDSPVRQSIPSVADSSMSFGWIESQMVDFDD